MKNARKIIGKRLAAAALTALAVCATALAESAGMEPAVGVAVACPPSRTERVPLFAQADESSEVLMNYFAGAQLDVVAIAENGMAQVHSGTLEGYMRAGDLRYGAEAMREVRPLTASLELAQPEPVRLERSETSAATDEEMMFVEVWGMSDAWAQTAWRPVYLVGTWDGRDLERGFVPVSGGVASTEFGESATVTVVPFEDELTFEQAYERGIELALQNPELLTRIAPENRTSEALHALEADLMLVYNFDSGEAAWFAYYCDDADIDINFSVTMDPHGALIQIQATNG